MKKCFLALLIFSGVIQTSVAQYSLVMPPSIGFNAPDKYGRQFPLFSYAELKGSPYFSGGWSTGSIALQNGLVLDNISIRYNQVDELVEYQLDSTKLPLDKALKKFTIGEALTGNIFENGYPKINGNTDQTFYEVLSDGNIKLLKLEIKRIAHFRGYSQVVERNIVNSVEYYIFSKGKISPIKPSLSSAKKVLYDHDFTLKSAHVSKINTEEDLILFFNLHVN